MTLHPLEGHEQIRATLAGGVQSGRLPSTLLFHGPSGVGKQRLALWTGQLLLCDEGLQTSAPEVTEPCGSCRGCRLSLRLEHPDLHWYFPIPRPKARGSREKDREALEEARQERLAQLREHPLRRNPEEVRGIHLGTVHNLLREVSKRPAVGDRRLFLIAEAEALVAQESSAEAANALLKALEEPPAGTWFILTSSEPGRILPTIRSRMTSLHVSRLPDSRVRAFLLRHTDADENEVDRAVGLAGGSIGRAIGFLPEDGEPGSLEKVRQEAFHLLRAALSAEDEMRFARALSLRPAGARGLHELFTSLGTWVRDLAAVAESEDTPVLNRDATQWLRKAVSTRQVHPLSAAQSVELVENARARAAGNVNPQLLIADLLFQMTDAFSGQTRPTATAQSMKKDGS